MLKRNTRKLLRKILLLAAAGLVSMNEVSSLAQTPAPSRFAVATIKPAGPDERGMAIEFARGGGVNISNMTLKDMIGFAWNVQPFQISGGPRWLDSAHYDVIARPEVSQKQEDLRGMVQTLLEDRFQLKVRHKTEELPTYALVRVKKGGQLGPGMTESKDGSCTPFDPSNPPTRPQHMCGNSSVSPNRLQATSISITSLASMLQTVLGRTVVDKTDLKGNFDINMNWTPDETQNMQWPLDAPQPPRAEAAGPSIFTSIQEQLGLKFDSVKGPVDVLVVDHAELPSEN